LSWGNCFFSYILKQYSQTGKNMRIPFLTVLCFIFFLSQGFAQQGSPIHGTTIFEKTTTWDGKLLQYPKGEAKVTGVLLEKSPGAETGWHLHPAPNFCHVLGGVL